MLSAHVIREEAASLIDLPLVLGAHNRVIIIVVGKLVGRHLLLVILRLPWRARACQDCRSIELLLLDRHRRRSRLRTGALGKLDLLEARVGVLALYHDSWWARRNVTYRVL